MNLVTRAQWGARPRKGTPTPLNPTGATAHWEGPHTCTIATVYQLAAGDYVELMGLQASGGSLNMLASSAYSPEFYAHWLAT